MTKYIHFFVLLIATVIIINGCEREDIIRSPVISNEGVFVLYEGDFTVGSGDYTFIDLKKDSIYHNVFQNSNYGANLGLFPDGMILLYNQDLYIVSQGIYGGQGKMFKINATNNLLQDTVAFGNNPFNLTFARNFFYVTNISGNTITKIDMNLNVVKDINVGPNPQDILYVFYNLYVSKASYTSENSLTIINIFNDSTSKVNFNAPPVSVTINTGGVFVSTYTNKKLYVLDPSSPNQISDSITLNLPPTYPAIGDIVAGDRQSIYIVAVADTQYSGNIGKAVYKLNLVSKQLDPHFLIETTGSDDVYGITYEYINKQIWIANSRGGITNGEIKIYNENGVLQKAYTIGGKHPKRFAFKYAEQF